MNKTLLEKIRNFIFKLIIKKYEDYNTEDAVEIFEEVMQNENKNDILFETAKNFFSKLLKNKTKELETKKEAIILIELISKRIYNGPHKKYEPFIAIIGKNKITIDAYDVKKYKEMKSNIKAFEQLIIDYNLESKEAKNIIKKIRWG